MSYINLVRQRRSCRKYSEKGVERAKIERFKEVARRAPSSRNFRPLHFCFVTNRKVLGRLSRCKPHGAAFLAEAPLAIVVCADESKSDVWVEDASIASVMLQFAAQEQGLGSCWVQVRKRKTEGGRCSEAAVKEALMLEEQVRVLSIMGVGYPSAFLEPIPDDRLSGVPIRFVE